MNIQKLCAICLLAYSYLGNYTYAATSIEQELVMPISFMHETNPRLYPDQSEPVNTRIFMPRYNLVASDSVNTWSANLGYRIERSSDEILRVDREDPSSELRWRRELERGGFGVNFRYDERSTRETELDDSGLIAIDGTKKTKITGVAWSHIYSPNISFNIKANQANIRYENITLLDYTTQGADVNINYQISNNLSATIGYGKSEVDQEDDPINDKSSFITAGIRWELSETVRFNLDGGAIETQVDNNEPESDQQGNIGIIVESERLLSSINLSRRIAPSGLGVFTKSNQLIGSVKYDLNDRSYLNINFNIRNNITPNENKTFYYSLGYNRTIGDNFGVELTASNKKVETDLYDAENNMFLISFNYAISSR